MSIAEMEYVPPARMIKVRVTLLICVADGKARVLKTISRKPALRDLLDVEEIRVCTVNDLQTLVDTKVFERHARKIYQLQEVDLELTADQLDTRRG